MLSKNVTVCIFAWNEEKRILRCIENFKDTFEILVVDNYSTDNTVEVAQSAGFRCVRIKNPNFIETPEVMVPVMDACTTEYLLIASISEFLPLPLLQLYARVAETSSHDIVRPYRVSITAGAAVPISGVARKGAPGELRFFRKGSVDYTGNQVHDRGKIKCAEDKILNVVMDPALHFYQFRDYDCSKTETTHCRYDDLLAKQRFEAGQRFSWPLALYRSCRLFLASYLRCGSYRYGMLGFLHCYYRFQMEFTIWLRLWEWEHGYTRPKVIERNNSVRETLEAEFRAALCE